MRNSAPKDWWDKVKPFVEIPGLVLLFVYTIYTIKMYHANKQAADAATKAAQTAGDTLQELRNEQRPWIVVKDAKIVRLEPNAQGQVEIVFSNFGHTPALDARFVSRVHVSTDPNDALPPLGPLEDEITPAIVAPTMEMTTRVHTIDILNAQTVERAKKPDVRYYVYGEGTYTDTTPLRQIHHLQFCVYVRYGIPGVTPCANKLYKNATD